MHSWGEPTLTSPDELIQACRDMSEHLEHLRRTIEGAARVDDLTLARMLTWAGAALMEMRLAAKNVTLTGDAMAAMFDAGRAYERTLAQVTPIRPQLRLADRTPPTEPLRLAAGR